ncbi:PEP-CTERM sorting domain-containing protein [Rugamonas sp. FT82W]|uniref:PEP-CTERM sorting domain-containing protein n=1 Tax=Duganella vulcania TaxID=2692166 RepID=A0A845GAX2_9BURK|nr:FxDxF family PEP-CTERM protein [Duganella vulcania]MYM91424.1 PEP-CTERM sorting domain-containing protein [Duganella vulcania]
MKLNTKSVLAAALFAAAGFVSQFANAATASFDANGFASFHSDAFTPADVSGTSFHQTVTFSGLAAGIYNIDASISATRLVFSEHGVWMDGHEFELATINGKLKSGNLVYDGTAPLILDVFGKTDGAYTQAFFNGSVSVTAVPEPETYGMLLGGLALVGVVARRKAKKAA